MAARFGSEIVDHRTVVIASDGDLMEGISQEAIDIAGHLKLAKLTVLWDDNRISIDGPTSISVSTDQQARFAASGWNTLAVDGHDPVALLAALNTAYASDKPTLIACRTTIGFGSPAKAGSEKVHGSPLGAAEIEATRKALGWEAGPFEIPADALDAWRAAGRRAPRPAPPGRPASNALPEATRAEFQPPHGRRTAGAALKEAIAAVKAKAVADGGAVATRKVLGDRARHAHQGGARDARRLRRPHRLQQHPRQGPEVRHPDRLLRRLRALGRARARHGGGDERHRPPWRLHPL